MQNVSQFRNKKLEGGIKFNDRVSATRTFSGDIEDNGDEARGKDKIDSCAGNLGNYKRWRA